MTQDIKEETGFINKYKIEWGEPVKWVRFLSQKDNFKLHATIIQDSGYWLYHPVVVFNNRTRVNIGLKDFF